MKNIRTQIVEEKWFSVSHDFEQFLHISKLPVQLDKSLEIDFRSVFDRDRDRILFSKAFRRLNGKTQIFIPQSNDYIRTRLTHSLEVNQIARSIGKGLGLNLSLIEAIALGHDVGHTPFGHAGEYELNRIMNNCFYHTYSGFPQLESSDCGFKHNMQAIRILCEIEKIYDDKGLGLTPFTLWGILNHTTLQTKLCEYAKLSECPRQKQYAICPNSDNFSLSFYDELIAKYTSINNSPAWSFEGIVVNIADEIAQIHHDIEDSLYMKIISYEEAKSYIEEIMAPLIRKLDNKESKNIYGRVLHSILDAKNMKEFMSYTSKLIIDFLISTLINDSLNNFETLAKKYEIRSQKEFLKCYFDIGQNEINLNSKDGAIIPFDPNDLISNFQNRFKNRVINSEEVQKLNNLGYKIVSDLFNAFYLNPKILPDTTLLYFADESKDAYEIIKKSKILQIKKDMNKYLSRQKEGIGELRNQIGKLITITDENIEINKNGISLMRIVADHISGMTDAYALQKHKEIFGSDFLL